MNTLVWKKIEVDRKVKKTKKRKAEDQPANMAKKKVKKKKKDPDQEAIKDIVMKKLKILINWAI